MRREDYILKNKEHTESKIQRLLKSIKEGALNDRAEATEILTNVKAQISKVIDESNPSEEGFDTDAFVKLVQSAGIALTQAGAANEKLLKLATLLHKISLGSNSKNPKDVKGSVFGALGKLIEDDEKEDV